MIENNKEQKLNFTAETQRHREKYKDFKKVLISLRLRASAVYNFPVNKKSKLIVAGIFILLILFFAINNLPFPIRENRNTAVLKTEDTGNIKKAGKELSKRNRKIKNTLAGLLPKGNYIIIDTAKNIIYLKNSDRILHQAIISTGSGKLLIDPFNQERKWIFDTPRGEFKIKSKVIEPVWVKPDWAFIEEGEDIPKNYNDRMEPGVLGDYALGIGNGYFIHGTLYTRLLGKPVTHGCIRVGDSDLKIIYKAARIGTKVYIF
ncbi:MAG: L,D-transpeptidase [Nitrospinae bacterium]|nr:L,D-transpeptidase [Nitrospinota bacterium]MBI3812859.1 L,D-transpeptidase [Nitrospinota bacterium]